MSTRWVVSRRTLGAKIFSSNFQHRLQQAQLAEKIAMVGNQSKGSTNKDTTPWPRSLQIVGYTFTALTIPYTASVILVESRSIREWIENHMGSWGETMIQGVRWYWGEEEALPYGPILDEAMQRYKRDDAGKMNISTTTQEERQISLIGKEDPAIVRLEQERIQQRIQSPVHVTILGKVIELPPLLQPNISHVGTRTTRMEPLIELEGKSVTMDGHISIDKLIDEDNSLSTNSSSSWMNQLALSFSEDEPSIMDTYIHHNDKEQVSIHSSAAITKSTTVWSAWHHFKATDPSPLSSSSNQTNKRYYDDIALKIDEIYYNISELQRNMNDPSCLRDRDDMEKEYKELRTELGRLKRTKVWRRVKSLLYL